MRKPNKLRFKRLNRYSWSIIIAFICVTLAMQYHTAQISLQDFIQSLPLIAITVYGCEKYACLIAQSDSHLKKIELFKRDLFALSFSFLLGCLISLIFAYSNSDARGWWSLIIYLTTVYGFIFATIFSISAQLIKNHKKYTFASSVLIFILLSFGNFFPRYIHISFLGSIDIFYFTTCSFLMVHLLFCIGYQSVSFFLKQRDKP